MADYKETNISGNKWQRCDTITIFNPLNSTPSISFREQEVLVIGGEQITRPVKRPSSKTHMDGIIVSYNPSTVIQMYNPETLEPIQGQTFTHQDLYLMLFSAYINAAYEQDNSQ